MGVKDQAEHGSVFSVQGETHSVNPKENLTRFQISSKSKLFAIFESPYMNRLCIEYVNDWKRPWGKYKAKLDEIHAGIVS